MLLHDKQTEHLLYWAISVLYTKSNKLLFHLTDFKVQFQILNYTVFLTIVSQHVPYIKMKE